MKHFKFLSIFIFCACLLTGISFLSLDEIEFSKALSLNLYNPAISSTLISHTIELNNNQNIEIPAPDISISIPNSVIYNDLEQNTTATYVIHGVNSSGQATNWKTNFGTSNTFTPTAVGEYQLIYNADVYVYNRSMFEYNEIWQVVDNPNVLSCVKYFKDLRTGHSQIIPIDSSNFKFNDFTISKESYGQVSVYQNNIMISESQFDFYAVLSGYTLDDFEEWFNELKYYQLTSDAVTITVRDTLGPQIANYDYPSTMTVSELISNDITIYALEATDASGINFEKSKITVSYKLTNGYTGSRTYDDVTSDNHFYISNSLAQLGGKYTITYTVYDNNNNYSTKSYTIAVGDVQITNDNIAPQIEVKDGFLSTEYNVGSIVTLDLSKIIVTDDNPLPSEFLTLKLENLTTGTVYTFTETSTTSCAIKLTDTGSYRLTITAIDASDNSSATTIEFEVVEGERISFISIPLKRIFSIIIVIIKTLIGFII